MSRVIKFRAWNDIDKTMCDNGVVLHRLSALLNIKHYHVMQFTGLLDRHGVEIYEGDLVSIHDADDNQFLMSGVVKFGVRGYPSFDIYDKNGNTYTDEYNTFTNDNDLYFTVFGNIHENKELLNHG